MNFKKNLFLNCPKEKNKKNKKNNDNIIEYKRYISYKLSNTDNLYECVICLEKMKNNDCILLAECFHMYHKNCISEWFERSNICPICDFKL